MKLNFDQIIGDAPYAIEFGGYRFDVKPTDDFNDIIDAFRELAEYLLTNDGEIKTFHDAAEYFHIPQSFVDEIWDELSEDNRMYA